MKHITSRLLFIPLTLIFLQACQKRLSGPTPANTDQTMIAAARNYFEQTTQHATPATPTGNPRLDGAKTPDWGSAYCIQLSHGPAVIVPVYYQKELVITTNFNQKQVLPLNQLTKLVICPDSSGFHMELVTSFPDSNANQSNSIKFSILFHTLIPNFHIFASTPHILPTLHSIP